MSARYQRHAEKALRCEASSAAVFTVLDDQERLGAHMNKPSWMMLGGKMQYELDEAKGRSIGSIIRMQGSVLGFKLALEEVVIERDPPHRKVWETRGTPQLIVMGGYRLGFEIEEADAASSLRVFIDYDLPHGLPSFLSEPLARGYANWCVTRMANEAVAVFNRGRNDRQCLYARARTCRPHAPL